MPMIASLEEVKEVQASGAPSPSVASIACVLDLQMAIFPALTEVSSVYLKLAHELNRIVAEKHVQQTN